MSHERECCYTEYHHGCDAVVGCRAKDHHTLFAFIQQLCELYSGSADTNKKLDYHLFVFF